MVPLNLPVFSCSLDPASRSRLLAESSTRILRDQGHHSDVVDLAEYDLPSFDNHNVFSTEAFRRLYGLIAASDGVVLAFPVYNWAPASTVKSLIEATGATGSEGRVSAWFDKVVTFVCAAGLPHSYMAAASLGQSLMLDFKCVINPYTAYISERDWERDARALRRSREDRLNKTMSVHAELSGLLAQRSYRSDWEV